MNSKVMKPVNFSLLSSTINCVSFMFILTESLKVVFKFSKYIAPSSRIILDSILFKKFKPFKFFVLTFIAPFKFSLFKTYDLKIFTNDELSLKIFFKSIK
jgi:hypothetical protein